MTFAPTKKTSRSRSRRRTSNWIKLSAKKLENRVVFQYNDKKEVIGLAHMASPVTGQYKGRDVIKKKTKKKKVTRV